MMARWLPKQFLVMLLAVFLTAGFSLPAAQASAMAAKTTTMTDMAMPSDAGMAKVAATDSDCGACLKGASDTGNPMHCPPTCIAPAMAVLPQGLAMTMVLRAQQPTPLPYPQFRGHSPLPDPSPPRPRDIV
jgi:hypothetical protein